MTATESSSGLAKAITIKAPTSLSADELKQLQSEANEHENAVTSSNALQELRQALGETLTFTLNLATSRADYIGESGMATVEHTISQFRQQTAELQNEDDADQLRRIVEKWSEDLDAATQ